MAVYQTLWWAHLVWLAWLGMLSLYALVLTAFQMLLWPVGEIAGLAGAAFGRREHGDGVGIVILLALAGANAAVFIISPYLFR